MRFIPNSMSSHVNLLLLYILVYHALYFSIGSAIQLGFEQSVYMVLEGESVDVRFEVLSDPTLIGNGDFTIANLEIFSGSAETGAPSHHDLFICNFYKSFYWINYPLAIAKN